MSQDQFEKELLTPASSHRCISGFRYTYVNWKPLSEKEAEAKRKSYANAKKFKIEDEKGKVVGYRVYVADGRC